MPALYEHASVGALTVGICGARGYVGRELIALLGRHPTLRLAAAWSESLAGESVASHAPGAPEGLVFETPEVEALRANPPTALVLALPNGRSREALEAVEAAANPPRVIVDLSADHRFDADWVYGLPEIMGDRLRGAARIANPGCYATAARLALHPIINDIVGVPHCFGVSGHSGAGSTPNERNDVEALSEGVLPYSCVGHLHERELSHTSGVTVRFAPSVAGYERGIVLTALFELKECTSVEALAERYDSAYSQAALVETSRTRMPRLRDVVRTPKALVGGLHVDKAHPTRCAAVCVLDNLLKGAASQALQNLNLALGLPELEGLAP